MAEPRATEAPVARAGEATDELRASSAAEQLPPPTPAPADDELLCTICGLTACWKAPDKAKGS